MATSGSVSSSGGRPVRPGSCETIDPLSSNTLKRHPKMDLNKADMLQLLSYLEGELQARDVVIATLKAEKAKHFLYEAKYGRFGGLGDPLHALQRDSELNVDSSFDESAVRAMYDDQLTQLDNLITTQHRAQQQMREQLAAVDKRYHKVCVELEEEKTKHARDMEQGDNVTYMLEKDRERLKQELEFEKAQSKKFERELKRASTVRDEDRAASAKHKQVALMLIRGRARLVQTLVELRARCAELESIAADARRSEATSEERHLEADFEREQLRARLARAETQNRELRAEIERLRGVGTATVRPNAAHPHVYISERTVSPTPPHPATADVRRPPMTAVVAPTAIPKLSPEADLNAALRTAAMAKRFPAPQTLHDNPNAVPIGPAVSLPVGPGPRKTVPAGRGAPPPIPPNKPQVVIAPQGGAIIRPASAGISPPAKPVGMAASKERTASMSDGIVGMTLPDRPINRTPSPRFVAPPCVPHAIAVRPPDVTGVTPRKPGPSAAGGQVCVNIKSQVG